MSRGSKFGLGALLLLFFAAANAGAEQPKARAARFFKAGQQAYIKGDFLTAIRAFEQSEEAKPHLSTVFNLAQAYRRQHEREKADWNCSAGVEGGQSGQGNPGPDRHRRAEGKGPRLQGPFPATVSTSS